MRTACSTLTATALCLMKSHLFLLIHSPSKGANSFSVQLQRVPRLQRGARICTTSGDNCRSRRKSLVDLKLHMSLKPPASAVQVQGPQNVTDVAIPDEIVVLNKEALVEVTDFDPFELSSKPNAQLATMGNLEAELADKVDNLEEQESEKQTMTVWMARAILLGVAILWGTNFASVKYLETLCFHPPCNHVASEAALARFGVAALAGIPFLWKQSKDVILAGLECGLFISLGYFSQAEALQTIQAGECAFICSLTVVVVPIISYLLYGKPVKPVNLIAAALAIGGVGILEGMVDIKGLLSSGMGLIQPAFAEVSSMIQSNVPQLGDAGATVSDAFQGSLASAPTETIATASAAKPLFFGLGKGELLALGQPLGFGYSFMRIEHYVEKFKDVPNRVLTISAAQCVTVGLLSLAWVLHDFNGHLPNLSYMIEPHRLGAIAWTGIMTTVVAIYFEGLALQVASATEAALLFASEPVWASMFGALLLSERLGINSYVGGAVILSACILCALTDSEKNPEAEGNNDVIEMD